MTRFFTMLLALAFAADLAAQDDPATQDDPASSYRAAATSVDADLRSALDELATARARIAAEKPDIAAEANRIAADLREMRRKADLARTSRDAAEDEFEKLESDLKIWRDEGGYMEGLLLEFRKNFESQQSIARSESDRDRLSDNSLEGRLSLVEEVLSLAEGGGVTETFPGEAIGAEGTVKDGTFIEIGPISWFLSSDESAAGIVTTSTNLRPELVPDTADARELKELASGGTAAPAFDPTLGTAVALAEGDASILSHIEQGGFWIWPILLLAAVALVAAIAKWIQLLKIRDLRPEVVQAVLDAVREGDAEKAGQAILAVHHPARAMLSRGIDLTIPEQTQSREEIEEALYEKYIEAIPPLQRGLALIAITSATAPLLGLLGTVTGMIETFRLINIFGTGDAKSLASGISEALVTTEFGLIVAIPALILHALLSRKVQGIRNTMEMTSLAFINGLPGKD